MNGNVITIVHSNGGKTEWYGYSDEQIAKLSEFIDNEL